MDSGVKCGLQTKCRLNAAYWLQKHRYFLWSDHTAWRSKCHLVKLCMCYHPKMAGIGDKGCNSQSLDFQDSKVVIVKCLTGCWYLHGEAIDSFQLHKIFEKSPQLIYFSQPLVKLCFKVFYLWIYTDIPADCGLSMFPDLQAKSNESVYMYTVINQLTFFT